MNNVTDYTKQAAPATRSAANRSEGAAARSLPAVPVLQEKNEDAQALQNGNGQGEYSGTISTAGGTSTDITPDFPGSSQANSSFTTQSFKAPLATENNSSIPTQFKPAVKTPNLTGLPDRLKAGIESYSGYAMDDVKVHFNSDKPAQLQAHAYAQGSNIHLSPGQEKHLPHEAWHVVQQKQGRVQSTIQMKGRVNVNDDEGLEKEADEMGMKALQLQANPLGEMIATSQPALTKKGTASVKQLKPGPSLQNNATVLQLTRLSTVAKADYPAKLAEILELGVKIGEASASGVVHKGTLKKAAFDTYQEDGEGDVPIDEAVAVKIVSTHIEMNADGDVPMEVHVRDEIEAKNQAGAAKPTITPDTYEVITVTDPAKESEVIKYVIIMRLEKEGSMASKAIRKISQYNPTFDKEMKKYANELKAALEVVKAAGYHPGDMKADNTLITDVDGGADAKRAILADFGSYKKAQYDTLMDDITFVMNSIFCSKEKLPKKDKAAVITWMGDDQLWKPAVVAPAQAAGGVVVADNAGGDDA
ncbi:MAG: DUF4157 domain-containing protein [Bacteroidota bacterium]